jgi:hypothetical protein
MAVCFVDSVISPPASWHTQQRVGIMRCKLHLQVDNAKGHTVWHVQEEGAGRPGVRLSHFYIHPTWTSQIGTCLGG